MSTIPRITFYSAWFCPYAQRVWAALNLFDVNYDIIEALGTGFDKSYTKHPDLLKANSKGLVPTLIIPNSSSSTSTSTSIRNSFATMNPDSNSITDSFSTMDLDSNNDLKAATQNTIRQQDDNDNKMMILSESIDIVKLLYHVHYHQKGNAITKKILSPLMNQQYKEAIKFNQNICSPFYKVLMKPNETDRVEAWENMVLGMSEFSKCLHWRGGVNEEGQSCREISFYHSSSRIGVGGNTSTNKPTIVDLTVFPWIHRLFLLDHYRGFQLKQSKMDDEMYNKIIAWKQKMEELDCVKATLPDPDELIKAYKRYANGSAESKVGDAIRKGKEAHELD